ncbi:chaperone protein dnaJ C76, chloroplastic [Telopea speciosissima]|uniref:chaperone protein dnaJ C76, chloroplastic n=1 Tax=Telopea speciosissima TaxID=54955 RepID=UPI001CC3D4C8|nr:chaperone protein dnaJ C76, chloroplastic [Telopea speciosissima]
MPSSTALVSYTPPASTIIRPSNLNPNHQHQLNFLFCSPSPPRRRTLHHLSFKPRVSSSSSSSSSSSITEFDLYELLGIDSTSNQSQIKYAYRSLQKRCHPDIAGPAGHDMAIILNEAYSVLSDPNSRLVYDKEQSKITEFKGYTGKPLYSTWFGPETEERAVFVDEVKCVGCLKCALLAQKTFAIESAYGRARVVGQWADPEDTIQEAVDACPVNCIWFVERSNLAALEYLMSKQPRGNVRMSAGNAVGTRVADVLTEVEKFQTRYVEAKRKGAKSNDSKESDLQREAIMSAIHSIRSFSNWWYWISPKPGESCLNLIPVTTKPTLPPGTDKLRKAVAARRQAAREKIGSSSSSSSYSLNHEYWKPSPLILPAATTTDQSSDSNSTSGSRPKMRESKVKEEEKYGASVDNYQRDPIRWRIPVAMATVGAVIVRLQVGDQGASGSDGLKDHIAGSMVLQIVNSSWLQVILAGVTWYLIGMAMVELVDVFRIKGEKAGNKRES